MATPAYISSHSRTAELPRLDYPDPRLAITRELSWLDVHGLRGRVRVAAAVLGVLAFVALGALVVHRRESRAAAVDAGGEVPAVFTRDDAGWRYVFHAPTGTEALYSLESDPNCRRNVIRQEPARAESMRARMLKDAGVDSLEQLQTPHQQTIESLKSLGYL